MANGTGQRIHFRNVSVDKWEVKELLYLASAVVRIGDQNWTAVSTTLRIQPIARNRPDNWFSPENCAIQYGLLLSKLELKRTKLPLGSETVESPAQRILERLAEEQKAILKKKMEQDKREYNYLMELIELLRTGKITDEVVDILCAEIDAEEKQQKANAETHEQWLKDREMRIANLKSFSVSGQKRKAGESQELLSPVLPSSMSFVHVSPHVPAPSSSVGNWDLLSPSTSTASTSSIATSLPASVSPEWPRFQPTVQAPLPNGMSGVTSLATESHNFVPTSRVVFANSNSGAFRKFRVPVRRNPAGQEKKKEKDTDASNMETSVNETIEEEVEPIKLQNAPITQSSFEPTPETFKSSSFTPCAPEEKPRANLEANKQKKQGKNRGKSFERIPALGSSKSSSFTPCASKEKPQADLEANRQKKQEKNKGNSFERKPTPRISKSSSSTPFAPDLEANKPKKRRKNNGNSVERKQTPGASRKSATSTPCAPKNKPKPDVKINKQKQQGKNRGRSFERRQTSGALGKTAFSTQSACKYKRNTDSEANKQKQQGNAFELKQIPGSSMPSFFISYTPQQNPNCNLEASKNKHEQNRGNSMKLKRIPKIFKPSSTTPYDLKEDPDGDKENQYRRSDAENEIMSAVARIANLHLDNKEPLNEASPNKDTKPPIDSIPNEPSSSKEPEDDRKYNAWQKLIMIVYNRIASHRYAFLFANSNSFKENPNHETLIYRPMDLQTLRTNIDSGVIQTAAQFKRDVMLIFTNAFMYCKRNGSLHRLIREIKNFASEQFRILAAAEDINEICTQVLWNR